MRHPDAWVALDVGWRPRRPRQSRRQRNGAETAVPAGTRVERLRIRAVGYERSPSPIHVIHERDITLDAFGDANFGDGAVADPATIRATIAAARRRADVVVATFHWGIERDPGESARQRELAEVAAGAGAAAIIGAHPHVLQPIRGLGPHRMVAYSLGNFVWAAGSPASAATGILEVELSARGVEAYRLRRATIVNTRPQLD